MSVENRPRSAEALAEQIEALVTFQHDGGDDGYSASADAMWNAAKLAFDYAAHKVGATGFQASWAALRFYGEAMSIDGPFAVIKAEDAVYPQYDIPARVRGLIEDEWAIWIEEAARQKLSEADHAVVAPHVLAHWKSLAGATS